MCQIVSKGFQRQHAPKTMIPDTYEDGWAQCSEMFGHSTEQAFFGKPPPGDAGHAALPASRERGDAFKQGILLICFLPPPRPLHPRAAGGKSFPKCKRGSGRASRQALSFPAFAFWWAFFPCRPGMQGTRRCQKANQHDPLSEGRGAFSPYRPGMQGTRLRQPAGFEKAHQITYIVRRPKISH